MVDYLISDIKKWIKKELYFEGHEFLGIFLDFFWIFGIDFNLQDFKRGCAYVLTWQACLHADT